MYALLPIVTILSFLGAAAGIFLGLPELSAAWLTGGALAPAAAAVLTRKPATVAAGICASALLSGLVLGASVTAPVDEARTAAAEQLGDVAWIAVVEEGARPARSPGEVRLKLVAHLTATGWQTTDLTAVASQFEASWIPATGDHVHVKGKFRPPTPRMHEFGFDAGRYARLIAVDGSFTQAAEPVLLRSQSSIRRRVDLFRIRLERSILTRVEDPSAGVLVSMLTSSRQSLDPEVRNQFAASGASHVLAVSGMHLVLLCMAVLGAFDRAFRFVPAITARFGAKRAAIAATLPIVILYVVLTGSPASAVRAGIMCVVMLLTELSGRKTAGIHALCAASVVMLWWRPVWILDIGFQLSVLATLGLIATSTISRKPKEVGQAGGSETSVQTPFLERYFLGRQFISLMDGMRLSVVACLATGPVLLWNFGQFPVLGPLTNLIVVPALAYVSMPVSAIGAALEALGLPGAGVLMPVADWATRVSLWLSDDLQLWLSYSLVWGRPNVAGLLGWSILGCFAPWLFVASRRKHAEILGAAAVLLLFNLPPWLRAPAEMRLHAIPVGQGDCTWIQMPGGLDVLVDAGGKPGSTIDTGTRYALPYLRLHGVARVEIVVATHADADHMMGLTGLLQPLHPREIWVAERKAVAPLDRDFRAEAERLRIPVKLVGDTLVTLPTTSANPQSVLQILPTPDGLSENDRSVVLRSCLGATCALATGDIEREREAWLLSHHPTLLQADVLKVAHHGSRTSSTAQFLDVVRPRIAILELGARNRFRFPHDEVMARLRARAARILRTDEGRAVRLAADGKSWREF